MSNRIALAIRDAQATLDSALADGTTTKEKIEKGRKDADMTMEEYVMFQELKSLAAGNSLTLDEAQLVYIYLGNSLTTFNDQPLAVKIILNRLFAELLQRRIAARRKGK